nr:MULTISPECIES: HAD-IIIA family hydrolase [Paraliobacillus]
MIKAVLFDLDGTLLDRDTTIRNFIEDQYDRFRHYLYTVPKRNYVNRFIELDQHGYVWKDKVYKELIEEYHFAELTWESMLEDYLLHVSEHAVAYSGLNEMIKTLKRSGYHLGIITNGKSVLQMNMIEVLNIKSYFDVILISESEGIKKPDPLIFQKALISLKVRPNESIYIGDHPKNDVQAAMSIGMQGIWKRNNSTAIIDADAVIDNLAEIPRIIENISHP